MRSFGLLLVVALLATACGDGGSSPAPTSTQPPDTASPAQHGELVRADVARATTTDVIEEELAALVAGDTQFALDLFRTVAGGDENAFLSPYSIAAALTMTYAGARGTTATEIAEALGITLPDERLHAARNQLDLLLASPPESPQPGDDREPLSIEIANSLWGQYDYAFLDEFLVALAENYDAGMNLVDFAVAAEEARVAINDWVEETTRGRIVDLIQPGVVDELTRLVLVNAIWFRGNWVDPFESDATAPGTFFLAGGGEVQADFMHGGGTMRYGAGDGYQAIRLPYAGGASMLVLVPDSGRFAEFVASLDRDFLAAIEDGMTQRPVSLSLPKFEFRSAFSLKQALEALGMIEAFQPPADSRGADFTGMTQLRELYVSAVVHQAFVSVDESGTEAAAATAVVMSLTAGVAEPPVTVDVDRPFVFAIQHDGTGEILFIGQVIDPS